MQFAPGMDTEENQNIIVFSSDVSKSLYFTYSSESKSTYSGFKAQTFSFNQGLNLGLGTSTFTGATNLTTTYSAPMFVSNGNFFEADTSVTSSLPTDASGTPFEATAALGDSWVVIDGVSGTTLQMQSSIQTNYQVFTDNLFATDKTSSFGQFVPQALILKQMALPDSTVTQLLGYEQQINSEKWTLFGVSLACGLVLAAIGVLLFKKMQRAVKKQEELLA